LPKETPEFLSMCRLIKLLPLLLYSVTALSQGQDSCYRFPVKPVSFINNPSFEISPLACTSGYLGQFNFILPSWTTPTNEMLTGYLNACTNFLVPDSLVLLEANTNVYSAFFPIVPQPIPDGQGVVAVSDFAWGGGGLDTYPFRKSYVNTCLSGVLKKDSLYRLDFYVGFGAEGKDYVHGTYRNLVPEFSQSPEKFTLFGLPNCPSVQLPLLGCPSVAGWQALASVVVSGSPASWNQASMQFRVNQDILALALGPSCDTVFTRQQDSVIYMGNDIHQNQYSYFLDKLQLYQAAVPFPVVKLVSGTFCDQSVTLMMQPAAAYAGSNMQWYRNDTALSGEIQDTLQTTRTNYGGGWYQCRVFNDSVCLLSDSFYVQWNAIPNPSLLGDPDTAGCSGDTILLNAFLDSGSTYLWQDGSTNSSFSVSRSGTYQVTVSNTCGTGSSQKTITFGTCHFDLSIPNAFTPNGDGHNDVFHVRYTQQPQQYSLNIFNRYGQRLFSSANPSEGWDGTYKGVPQPIDSYVWSIRYRDLRGTHHSLKGNVALIR
jgi:gliding motility-associated-like protein